VVVVVLVLVLVDVLLWRGEFPRRWVGGVDGGGSGHDEFYA
jgi:hypothetical protein